MSHTKKKHFSLWPARLPTFISSNRIRPAFNKTALMTLEAMPVARDIKTIYLWREQLCIVSPEATYKIHLSYPISKNQLWSLPKIFNSEMNGDLNQSIPRELFWDPRRLVFAPNPYSEVNCNSFDLGFDAFVDIYSKCETKVS